MSLIVTECNRRTIRLVADLPAGRGRMKFGNRTTSSAMMQFSTAMPCFGEGGRVRILDVKSLMIPEIKVIRFARFCDRRGFFAESFRKSDIANHSKLSFLRGVEFLQCNESRSKPRTVRGLHFQWNPYMGKLVRTLSGRMVDMALDIRKGSENFGKIIAYEMMANLDSEFGEWIWIPPGFAHGNFYREESQIEYFCSGEYSPGCEGAISPLAQDIDWSLCDSTLRKQYDEVIAGDFLITEKDRHGHSVSSWARTPNSSQFSFRNGGCSPELS